MIHKQEENKSIEEEIEEKELKIALINILRMLWNLKENMHIMSKIKDLEKNHI